MKVLIVDGHGGNIGKQLVKAVLENCKEVELFAVGTNSIATESMKKAGATAVATGENSVIFMSKKVDVIMGPIGIVIADALMGEVTANMAVAIGQSDARRILIPMTKCHTDVAGVTKEKTSDLIDDAIFALKKIEASLK